MWDWTDLADRIRTGGTAGELVAALARDGALRDVSVVEPDIEDVVARLYAEPAVT